MELKVDLSRADKLKEKYVNDALESLEKLINKNGKGSEFTGWVELPKNINEDNIVRIEKLAAKMRKNADVLVVIGIGGSYLGARAVIEALKKTYKKENFEVIFAGCDLSPQRLVELIEYLQDKDFYVNVISKSGTTLEPALTFRAVRKLLETKYNKDELRERIIVTTDREKGALKTLADNMGLEKFVVPSDIGGRYSVLTDVGLIPIAAAGLNIRELLSGALTASKEYTVLFKENNALRYAALRQQYREAGKDIEIFASYEPKLNYIKEWLKQLFGESEGKDGLGIFPASATFTTDLHSIGQLIQDGKRNIFETIIYIEEEKFDMAIPYDEENLDNLNYLQGKNFSYVQNKAKEGVIQAHVDGLCPNIVINLPSLDEYNLGKLIYFFMISCAISAYIEGVNPFDQPGVEAYKKNMFKLLGRD
ncbi:glucose-6-phosphate isomerase [Citroniella saccharovorans]|uniref:Glucose-6-phosphate isomerase n=1 Tax=Citroniella saccharovorans TaxID=2053367 RepID=A0AAW9MS64_9FIRM|nr:glucose-6-phosphate isomerase [Citroniella saccharovorans]MEB3429994.1 glucose-6-phosphate isomerase [Citroniella saccharovorans]